MRIASVGGGPAGLYFAISMKLRMPDAQIEIFERNKPGDTFGWGVVFSDQTMANLRANDPASAVTMEAELAHWDDIDVHVNGTKVTSTGHGFIGIGRKRLLNILQDRCAELGVIQHFEVEVDPTLEAYKDFDLVIASDGLNSRIRAMREATFKVDIDMRPNKFVWLGTHQLFDAFKFIFVETEHGWVWAHAYRFDSNTSTFIVECQPDTFAAWGFGEMSQEETCRVCEAIFADHLGGHPLMTNSGHVRGSAWINFPRVLCHQWYDGNLILLGDAAHTAHYSIGSGTKLAFEDAIKLAQVLADSDLPLADGLRQYQDERHVEVLKLQSAAKNSMGWFEEVDRYLHFDPLQFTYALLTRSQRVSHENLRLRDPAWLAQLEKAFAEKACGHALEKPVPPIFTPFRLRGMELANRVTVSPMAMYSAGDGVPNDFHLVHYGARALGGAGLVFTEMTCVSPEGRITPGCTGLYSDEAEAAWQRIVSFVHTSSASKIALQLGHSGAKGSTRLGWDAIDAPLEQGNWPLIAASAVPWSTANQAPREMTRGDMDLVRDQFVAATVRAARAGFDMVEFHAAHGYLLSSFITPVLNRRTDEYGGSLENRLRYPLEVFRAMRAVWPAERPMSVRISATDWIGEGGMTARDAVEVARAFRDAGADLIDVSTGQTTREARPVYGRMYQTPFADLIRNELDVPVMAVGNIFEVDHVNSILASGRADLCALGRPHLIDPAWTLRAAAELGSDAAPVPLPYRNGFDQLSRNLARAHGQAVLPV
ncbi:bifunctional salicylyl-CoA 5-hydroxylase/oxidoreductase [Novosphingobium sp.]|uniref:bifunctional salicylyl-CoA 5-hydroxylase/oxidoreductase n=1 Tax=Novosphingobium sp. TaxID=1874826 RepID=UPI0033422360